ncbi:metallophosphoesterase family protein [Pseudomonas sp. BJa5]|uniref:metallophosphoesterase family protein n=1 Tax=Pseudomonas sp. BJa5 TaxID=2936270 RepID=UPI0025597E57|nr:metallophosphoesterase [Pseudomonas sp. BGr12]MDL2424144.1 metallophosphoesterase [Pseudomonas sp. BGr12]
MVSIVHISDLHIAERLFETRRFLPYLPHRHGHDNQAFLALDSFLKTFDWDLLIITGDISRTGRAESFGLVKNWLDNEITFGANKIGLNLSKSKSRRYVVVPGNHDRFNGKLKQHSLDNYHDEFPAIHAGAIEKIKINGITLNIHLFNSTWKNGSFAYGKIDQRALAPKTLLDSEIDLAVLHHHFIQPPNHTREVTTELANSAEVAAYILSTGFDGVFFGHTHKSYIDQPSAEVLSNLLDRRKRQKFWSKHVPNIITRLFDNDGLVAYTREAAQNGQLPTLESYFSFLYLRRCGLELRSPSEFKSIHAFHEQMKQVATDPRMAAEISNAKKRKILISLAPSACQDEAKWKGLHVVKISKNAKGVFNFEWDRYQLEDGRFCAKPKDLHVS